VKSVRIIVNATELIAWETFWSDLNYGTDKFTTDQAINGDNTTGKTARFTSGYTLAELGAEQYEISVPVELIQTGV